MSVSDHPALPEVPVHQAFDIDEVADLILENELVIPVIGPQLSDVIYEGQVRKTSEVVNELLIQKLGIDPSALPARYSIDDIAATWRAKGGQTQQLHRKISSILSRADWEPGPTLTQLASLNCFRFFVSTTFDLFLEKALNRVRFGGESSTVSMQYLNESSKEEDIPRGVEQSGHPIVYHLFGTRSSGRYGVTEADLLEYVSALLNDSTQPKRLFQLLKSHHLLFLGTGFKGWLNRFFLRATRATNMTQSRSANDFLVDPEINQSADEVRFLANCSGDCRIYPQDQMGGFLDALQAEVGDYNPVGTEGTTTLSIPASDEEDASGPPETSVIDLAEAKADVGSIFLSYARDDSEATRRVYERLKQEGLDVWMDVHKLQSGDWLKVIERNIKASWLFIPILSKTMTSDLSPRVFREEWKMAFDINKRFFGTNVVFIHPLRVDDVDLGAEGVDLFSSFHVPHAPEGDLSAPDIEEIKALYQKRQLSEKRG